MEDFSDFIHEELFLIDTKEEKEEMSTDLNTKKTYKLGVMVTNTSGEDEILLEKILSALKLDSSEILIATTYQSTKSNRWIVFAESFNLESTTLEFYQPCKIKETTFVLAQPLSKLHESQEEKQKLWNVLKVLV